ncbi:MAG: hypothetical protein DHS20C18_14520 [Saprospiraceae bacterium]|nr:MAG: hypothetical protein DHS20C18_14520 [Saprospiraceae bacterium]
MDFTLLYLFLFGGSLSFLGTIPLGPINLSIVDTTIKYHIRAAIWVALGATVVEICNSFIALYCNTYVHQILETGFWTRLVTAILFLLFGSIFFFRENKVHPEMENDKKRNHHFLLGIGVALLNLQSIPYWIYFFSALKNLHPGGFGLHMQVAEIIWLLLGIASGKFFALLCFGWLSQLIKSRVNSIRLYMNKIIGGVLIIIGIVQAFRAFI